MKVEDLSKEDLELLLAFVGIARSECAGRGWHQIETRMAACWERMRSATSPEWHEISKYVETACSSSG